MFNFFKSLKDGSGPMELLNRTIDGMPPEIQAPVRELLDLLARASFGGPPDPPVWLQKLFVSAGRETGLSAELLAAVSWVLSRYDPRCNAGSHRIGIMGLNRSSLANPADFGATWEDLEAREPRALKAVWANVQGAARAISASRTHAQGGLLEALSMYAPPEDVAAIVGAYMLYLGRKLDPARAREIEGVNHGK